MVVPYSIPAAGRGQVTGWVGAAPIVAIKILQCPSPPVAGDSAPHQENNFVCLPSLRCGLERDSSGWTTGVEVLHDKLAWGHCPCCFSCGPRDGGWAWPNCLHELTELWCSHGTTGRFVPDSASSISSCGSAAALFGYLCTPANYVDSLVRGKGLERRFRRRTLVWQVVVYGRQVANS